MSCSNISLLTLVALIAYGCGNSNPDIIGKWEMILERPEEGGGSTFIFNEDGSGSFGSWAETNKVTHQFKEGHLYINHAAPNGQALTQEIFYASRNGNILTLKTTDSELRFKKSPSRKSHSVCTTGIPINSQNCSRRNPFCDP